MILAADLPQEYRPEEVAGEDFYEPSPHGAEATVGARLAELRATRAAQRRASARTESAANQVGP